jgi:hypothetical protein
MKRKQVRKGKTNGKPKAAVAKRKAAKKKT